MINKKTIAIKENAIQLAVNRALANRTLQGFLSQMGRIYLSQIGRVYEIPFSNGRSTTAVILTYEGVKKLGIDLNTVFKGCRGREKFNEGTDVKNGVLVNLDLYQQVVLLRAIVEKRPELKEVLGLYNLRGSRKVYEVLNRAGVPRQLGIWWMWTADIYIEGQNNEGDYPEEGIVTLVKLPTLQGNRFVNRNIVNDRWDNYYDPGDHNNLSAAVFGELIL